MIYLVLIPPALTYILAGLFGGIAGTLLNRLIHQVPYCGASVTFHGKLSGTGHCEDGIHHTSIRFPVIEATTALLCVVTAVHDGVTLALPFDLVFISALAALIFFDGEHMILPDVITKPGICFALVARLAIPYLLNAPHFDDVVGVKDLILQSKPNTAAWFAVTSLIGALIGALVGGGSLFLMGEAWKKLRKVEAMGLGDVKMLFMVGGYLGWRLTILTIFLGALLGSIGGIGITLYERRRDLQRMLPYGVYLGIAAIISLFFGTKIIEWYKNFYQ